MDVRNKKKKEENHSRTTTTESLTTNTEIISTEDSKNTPQKGTKRISTIHIGSPNSERNSLRKNLNGRKNPHARKERERTAGVGSVMSKDTMQTNARYEQPGKTTKIGKIK